jgi:hypothetical protein
MENFVGQSDEVDRQVGQRHINDRQHERIANKRLNFGKRDAEFVFQEQTGYHGNKQENISRCERPTNDWFGRQQLKAVDANDGEDACIEGYYEY